MHLKNKIKHLLFASLLLISSSAFLPCYAFESNNDENISDEINEVKDIPVEKNYKGLGVTAGLLSGVGFSYRQYFNDNLGFKVSGVAFFDQNQMFADIGLQGMYVFSENNWLRFYALGGVSNYTTKRPSYNNYPYPVPPSDNNSYDSVVIPSRYSSNTDTFNSIGAGIGIELGRQAQGLSLALELPLIVSFRNLTLFSFYPIPQLSILYNF
jgi:hypothetical protein